MLARYKLELVRGRATNGVFRGTMFSLDADSPIATVFCSLEARRLRAGEVPLRGFFVAQEESNDLKLGTYRLCLDNGREEVVQVDNLTPLASQSRHLGSFEIVNK